ncbi:hypothetical protein JD844_018604 [Phrynosoma platyrhinos]|uniref:Shisa N-terminal domain-containing protein n=1 Tax=Phrynosoma platyrhinos TaxID=52577 RepID=A0ABQ7SNV4_PHRPL|nr:hypothetical protein JD844_018604 [Phrynosoma platyrhinos]
MTGFCDLPSVSGDEDCKWYMDRNGSLHHGFDCYFPYFCCGDCYHRYCCTDLRKLISERQQKHCMAFNPRTIAGIASAVILFVAIVATIVCCFLCSCCYLYQRRHHIQTPYQEAYDLVIVQVLYLNLQYYQMLKIISGIYKD